MSLPVPWNPLKPEVTTVWRTHLAKHRRVTVLHLIFESEGWEWGPAVAHLLRNKLGLWFSVSHRYIHRWIHTQLVMIVYLLPGVQIVWTLSGTFTSIYYPGKLPHSFCEPSSPLGCFLLRFSCLSSAPNRLSIYLSRIYILVCYLWAVPNRCFHPYSASVSQTPTYGFCLKCFGCEMSS